MNAGSTSGSNGNTASVLASLRARLEQARLKVDEAQREYEQALDDSDVIQEDRDALRQLLEEATARERTAETAVARFDAGDYGRCERCGEAIDLERLEAVPDTVTCRGCAS